MNADSSKIDAQYQTQVVLWVALTFSQVIFLVIAYVTKPDLFHFDFSQPVLGANAPVIVGLAAAAISCMIASFVIEKKMLAQSIDDQSIAMVQSSLIVSCSICEAVSVLGLVAAFAFNYGYFFIFIAVGIFGTVFHFPKRSNILAATYKEPSV